MWAQYSLYTLPLKNGRLRKPEELPKERSMFDCIINIAISEATAGKAVYLLAMDSDEKRLLNRIRTLHPIGVKGKLVACTPQIRPSIFDVPHWVDTVPENGNFTVVIYGADMIFNSYATAVRTLKKAQEIKDCEIIFAWRDEDMLAVPPPVFFEAWDELNVEREKPIPAHTPFKLTKEECYSNPKLMQDPLLVYCPAKEIAFRLDPDDPRDKRLLEAFDREKGQG